MGYSAGGYLALLYAYKNPTQIDLVISEAGPTHFVDYNNDIIVNNGDIFSMTGIAWDANGVYSNEDKRLLKQASPYWIVEGTSDKSIFPYTILAYGNGLPDVGYNYGDENGNGILDDGDRLIPFTQATALQNVLGESKCSLFELINVGHNDFGEGDNNKNIYPSSNNPDSIAYFLGFETAITNHLKNN